MLPAVMALALAGCANMPSLNRSENATTSRQANAFSTYLSARFAAGEHALPEAAHYYTQSLKQDPGNASILSLAFFYTTTSGDVEGAGKYATQIVAKTPDERSARLALAVIAFKHKDYAEVRKNLSLSAKGPFTTLTSALLDGWAAAAARDSAGMQKDLLTLSQQSGAENMAAFHTALMQDYLGDTAAAETAYKKALGSGQPTPRVLEAYGRFLYALLHYDIEASVWQESAAAAPFTHRIYAAMRQHAGPLSDDIWTMRQRTFGRCAIDIIANRQRLLPWSDIAREDRIAEIGGMLGAILRPPHPQERPCQ